MDRIVNTPEFSLGLYKITYEKNGFVQYKHLIPREKYFSVFKPLMDEITDLEIAATKKNKQETEKRIKAIKRQLKEQFGEYWFLTESPLFEAIETGIIELLPHMGGQHKCKIEKIHYF